MRIMSSCGGDNELGGRGRRHVRRLLGGGAATMCATVAMSVATAGGAAAVTTDVGLWHLDETSGAVAADGSGSGHDGVLHGGVVQGVAGHDGTAYSFETPGSWVEVADSAGFNPGTSNFSVSAWVNLSKAPGDGVTYDIIRKGLTTTKTGEFKLEIVKGGKVRCTAKDSARLRGAITGPRTNIADGTWHHVGCARVGSSWRVTVDARVRSKTVAFGSIGNTRSLSIGSKYGQEDATPGRVDEVRFTIG